MLQCSEVFSVTKLILRFVPRVFIFFGPEKNFEKRTIGKPRRKRFIYSSHRFCGNKHNRFSESMGLPRLFFVRNPSHYVLMKCGTRQFWHFENEFQHFENEFHPF